MKLIVCVDERGGMMFNKRRQSSDGVQISDMKVLLSGQPLSVSPYSAKLLFECGIELEVSDTPQSSDGYAFIENTDLPSADAVDTLIIYHWGRHYPSDKRFNLDMTDFKLCERYEFAGTAHSKIVREIYKK